MVGRGGAGGGGHLTDGETEAGLRTGFRVQEQVSGWWKENSGVLPSSLPLTSTEHFPWGGCEAGQEETEAQMVGYAPDPQHRLLPQGLCLWNVAGTRLGPSLPSRRRQVPPAGANCHDKKRYRKSVLAVTSSCPGSPRPGCRAQSTSPCLSPSV